MTGGEITLTAGELFLGGMATFTVLVMVGKLWAGRHRARVAAEIARVGTGVVSLVGRVLLTAAGIVGAQWLVITYAATNLTLLLVVLALPALFAAHTLTKALTVTEVRPTSRRGGRR
jgi:hypothetical protein